MSTGTVLPWSVGQCCMTASLVGIQATRLDAPEMLGTACRDSLVEASLRLGLVPLLLQLLDWRQNESASQVRSAPAAGVRSSPWLQLAPSRSTGFAKSNGAARACVNPMLQRTLLPGRFCALLQQECSPWALVQCGSLADRTITSMSTLIRTERDVRPHVCTMRIAD